MDHLCNPLVAKFAIFPTFGTMIATISEKFGLPTERPASAGLWA
jgi:hypothetical protein